MAALLVVAACGGSSPTNTPTPTPILTPTPVQETSTPAAQARQSTTGSYIGPDRGSDSLLDGRVDDEPTSAPSGAPAIVSMAASLGNLSPGQQFNVEVTLKPGGRGVSGVTLTMAFDPALLQLVAVAPGDVLGLKSREVSDFIPDVEFDNALGTIQYIDVRIGPTEPPTPTGLVASVRFRVLGNAPVGRQTDVTIEAVQVLDEETEEVAVESADELVLNVVR